MTVSCLNDALLEIAGSRLRDRRLDPVVREERQEGIQIGRHTLQRPDPLAGERSQPRVSDDPRGQR
jgi:hypothetical protein